VGTRHCSTSTSLRSEGEWYERGQRALLEEIRKQQEQIAVLLGEALIDPQAVAAKRERHCVLAGTVEQQDGGAPIDLGLLL